MTPLRQRMLEDMQVRNLAITTQTTYTRHVAQFARHFDRSPELLTPEDIRTYQVYLTNEKKVSPRSIIAATPALRFLDSVTLYKDWNMARSVPLPKEPQSLPIILSRDEVLHFLSCVRNFKVKTVLTTCYAAGLRISPRTCSRRAPICAPCSCCSGTTPWPPPHATCTSPPPRSVPR